MALTKEEIREKVNQLCALKIKQATLKKQSDTLEADFLKQAEQDLQDTKIKTVTYSGGKGNYVSVTMAATVKMEHPTVLKKAFGDELYKKMVTEKPAYEFNATAKRVLAGLFLDNYTKETLKSVFQQMGVDERTQKALVKKVKGASFKTDTKNIVNIAKVEKPEAQYYAYFAAEAIVWEEFIKLMTAKGELRQTEIDNCIRLVKNAVIVEETPKVTVEPAQE